MNRKPDIVFLSGKALLELKDDVTAKLGIETKPLMQNKFVDDTDRINFDLQIKTLKAAGIDIVLCGEDKWERLKSGRETEKQTGLRVVVV
jgi:hypothetical protein